jgi:DNA repair ATPase RecN
MEDKGLVKKIESERGRELFQKLKASLRELKAKWKQHKESSQANQELIEVLKIQVDDLQAVSQSLGKIVMLQQERLILRDVVIAGLTLILYGKEGLLVEAVDGMSAATKALNGAVDAKNEVDVTQLQKR